MTDFEIKLLTTALNYADEGFSVFPMYTKGMEVPGIDPKHTKDSALIREYWTGPFCGCQIGICTGSASRLWLLSSDKHPEVDNSSDNFKEYMEDRLGIVRTGPYWKNELGYNFVLNVLPDDHSPTGVLISDGIVILGDGGFVVPPRIINPEYPNDNWEHGEWFCLPEFRRSAFGEVPNYVRNMKDYICEIRPERVFNRTAEGTKEPA